MYEPKPSMEVEAWQHDHVLDEVVPQILPFRPDYLADYCPLIVDETAADPNATALLQVSPYHGRSFEVDWGKDGIALWQDEYGNPLTTLNIKGNSLVLPGLMRDHSQPHGFSINGLQEGFSLHRILKASRLLREAGVDTEAIVRVLEPKDLPLNGELLETDHFKAKLLQQAWERSMAPNDGQRTRGFTIEELGEIGKSLNETSLYVTVRAQLINERLYELEDVTYKDKETMKRFLDRVFRVANLVDRKFENNGVTYSSEDPKSVEQYFINFLPKRLGMNLAKMHNLGMSHRFLHLGNVSMVGGIYDLDAVGGEQFDDEAETEGMRIDNLSSLIGRTTKAWMENTLAQLKQEGYTEPDAEELFNQYRDTFLLTYIQERVGLGPSIESIQLINVLATHFGSEEGSWFREFYDKNAEALFGNQVNELIDRILGQDVDMAIAETLDTMLSRAAFGEIKDGQIFNGHIVLDDLIGVFSLLHSAEVSRYTTAQLWISTYGEKGDDDENSPYLRDVRHIAFNRLDEHIKMLLTEPNLRAFITEWFDRFFNARIDEAESYKALFRESPYELPELPEPKQMIAGEQVVNVFERQSLKDVLEHLAKALPGAKLPIVCNLSRGLFLPPFMLEAWQPDIVMTDDEGLDLQGQSNGMILPLGSNVSSRVWGSYRLLNCKSSYVNRNLDHDFVMTTELSATEIRLLIEKAVGKKLAVEMWDAQTDFELEFPDGTTLPI